MTLYNAIILSIKANLALFLNQARDYQQVILIVYQRLVKKLMYLGCGTNTDITFIIG